MSTYPEPDGNALSGYEYRRAATVALYLGDARQVLAAMPDASVDCVVTSPPFWQLRDYGTGRWTGGDPGCAHERTGPAAGASCPACGAVWTDPQYGLEATVDGYMQRLVAVFDQVWRVLTPDRHGVAQPRRQLRHRQPPPPLPRYRRGSGWRVGG